MRSSTLKKKLQDSWICFDQTFLGLELGTLFPARESMVSDIPAGDRNVAKLFLQASVASYSSSFHTEILLFLVSA